MSVPVSCRVTYSEFVGDHNEVCWRGSFADAIIALTAGF
jgi:enterochelin esterase-like enzyme